MAEGVRWGIPTVLDRFIQQLVLGELQPLYEPVFSQHSWGFRPGRGAHDAVRSAQRILTQEGKSWVVDMDIKGFFDNVDHDILMRLVGLQARDKRVLKLIGRMLRAGVWEEGRVSRPMGKGTPQGGPPLLANIYLDVLDKELERLSIQTREALEAFLLQPLMPLLLFFTITNVPKLDEQTESTQVISGAMTKPEKLVR